MSSDPPPRFSSSGISSRPRSGCSFVARPISGTFSSFCSAFASVCSASVHSGRPTFSMFACMVSATVLLKWPGQAEPRTREVHLGAGHHRGGLRHLVADVPHLLDVVVVGFAEVVPDRGVRRHDVRLIAAVGDDVVRALLNAQMLAAEIPADVHQLDGVERRASAPGRAGRVRAFALERVLDRDESVVRAVAPADAHVVARRARTA